MNPYVPFFGEYPASPHVHNYPPFRESATGAACAVCGKRPTLYHQGRSAYCKAHRDEARKAAETAMGVKR